MELYFIFGQGWSGEVREYEGDLAPFVLHIFTPAGEEADMKCFRTSPAIEDYIEEEDVNHWSVERFDDGMVTFQDLDNEDQMAVLGLHLADDEIDEYVARTYGAI